MARTRLLPIAVLLGLVWPGIAAAEINFGESLDWLTVDSDVVLRGEVVRRSGDEVVLGELVALRGRLDASTWTGSAARGCVPVPLATGEAVVVFLRRDGEQLVPRCATERARQWVISLDHPELAWALDGSKVGSGDAVVRYVAAASRRPVSRPVHPAPTPDARFLLQQGPMWLEVSGSDAGSALYGGSAVFLGIPAYEDLRAGILARAGSETWHDREAAARQLANYPGAHSERRLRALLDDPYQSEWWSRGKVVGHSWPVREAAWTSLQALGADLAGLEDPIR